MLELKDGSLTLGDKTLFYDLSFVALGKRVTCLLGERGCGKTTILQSFLGFMSLTSGYLTCDGELIDACSAPYFRKEMAYVPQYFRFEKHTVEQLFIMLSQLKADKIAEQKEALFQQFSLLYIDKSNYETPFNALSLDVQQRILLAFVGVLHKKIVLLDDPISHQLPSTLQLTFDYIRLLAAHDAVVLMTTDNISVAQQADDYFTIQP